ncbi:hypothetical protein ACOMHN_038142 [Nucella lapillus]
MPSTPHLCNDSRANNGRANNGRANNDRANNDRANNDRANNGRANNDRANNGRDNNGRDNNGRANNDRANNSRANNDRANNGRANNGRANNDRANNGRANNGRANNDRENNGRVNNGRANNGRVNNRRVNDGSVIYGRVNNGRVNDGRVNNGRVNNGWVNNERVNDGRVNNGRVNDGRVNNGRVNDGRVNNGRVNDGRVNNGRVNDGRVNNGRVNNGRVNNGRVNNGRVNNGRVNNGRVNNGQVNNGRANDGRANRADNGRARLQHLTRLEKLCSKVKKLVLPTGQIYTTEYTLVNSPSPTVGLIASLSSLQELHISANNLSDQLLLELSQAPGRRTPLRQLVITFRKTWSTWYSMAQLSSAAWHELTRACPSLAVDCRLVLLVEPSSEVLFFIKPETPIRKLAVDYRLDQTQSVLNIYSLCRDHASTLQYLDVFLTKRFRGQLEVCEAQQSLLDACPGLHHHVAYLDMLVTIESHRSPALSTRRWEASAWRTVSH